AARCAELLGRTDTSAVRSGAGLAAYARAADPGPIPEVWLMGNGGARVVTDVNRIPKVLAQLNRLNVRKIEVGIFEDAPSLVNIAAMNEFGVDIPVDAKVHRHLRMLAREHGAPTETLPRE